MLTIAPQAHAQTPDLLRQHIKTVFVLFQENRSFDHYFGSFPGADGLFSDGLHPRPAARTPGFIQPIINLDGSTGTISPFRIGNAEHAADLSDPGHAQDDMLRKMDLVNGMARMDRYALEEEAKRAPQGPPSLAAKQFGELSMAYVDCDTIPFLWRYARNFTLFDHMFQTEIGPSTPNAIAVIAGQAGESQRRRHPDQQDVPIRHDPPPLWGVAADALVAGKVAPNLTFATMMLVLAGKTLPIVVQSDQKPAQDLPDLHEDITAIAKTGKPAFGWAWYQEGYDREPTDGADAPAGGTHQFYIAHHNGPQYFGYISNNPEMTKHEHGLGEFFTDLLAQRIPQKGVVYVRGGSGNLAGLTPPTAPGLDTQRFRGDDDHPGYSDSQISEALVAREINAIVRSPYWATSAIVVIYDESGGFYDHEPPQILNIDEHDHALSRGPRFPMILISPYARDHFVDHAASDHNALLAFLEHLFDIPALESLPDEQHRTDQHFAAPRDADDNGTLLSAFDPARLAGRAKPIDAEQALIPDSMVGTMPPYGGRGCQALHIIPEDARQRLNTRAPADFSPRPSVAFAYK